MPTASPFFSIVIPAKNEEAFISQALLSIAQQTCVDSATPIFLCDANSSDATVVRARQIAADYQLNLTIAPGGLPQRRVIRGRAWSKHPLYFLWMPT